jgi:hypothetical protein
MMAKNPEDRYSSWKEFEQAVNNAFFSTVKAPGKTPVQRNPCQERKKTAGKKDKTGTAVSIVNSLILIAVAVLAAYFIYEYKKNSSAERNLKTAEQYYLSKPLDFNESLRLFSIAKETARGTKHYPYASRKYDEISAKAYAFKLKADNFDETLKKARALLQTENFRKPLTLSFQSTILKIRSGKKTLKNS